MSCFVFDQAHFPGRSYDITEYPDPDLAWDGNSVTFLPWYSPEQDLYTPNNAEGVHQNPWGETPCRPASIPVSITAAGEPTQAPEWWDAENWGPWEYTPQRIYFQIQVWDPATQQQQIVYEYDYLEAEPNATHSWTVEPAWVGVADTSFIWQFGFNSTLYPEGGYIMTVGDLAPAVFWTGFKRTQEFPE